MEGWKKKNIKKMKTFIAVNIVPSFALLFYDVSFIIYLSNLIIIKAKIIISFEEVACDVMFMMMMLTKWGDLCRPGGRLI